MAVQGQFKVNLGRWF